MTEATSRTLYRTITHIAPDPRVALPAGPRAARVARASASLRPLEAASTLLPHQRTALATLLAWWPMPPPAGRSRSVVEALADTDVFRWEAEQAIVRPEAIAHLAAAIDPDAAWLERQGRFSMAGLAEVRRARVPLEAPIASGGSTPTEGGAGHAARPISPTLARSVMLSLSDSVAPGDLAALASALRGTLAQDNAGLHLLDADDDLIAKQRATDDPHVDEAHFVRAMSAGQTRGWSALLSETLVVAPDPAAVPMTRDAAMTFLIAHAAAQTSGPVDDPFVEEPIASLHDLPWTCVARLAARDDLEARLTALLDERDWDSFDAPGEGDLPSLWRDALIVAGKWSPTWQTIWSERFDEDEGAESPTAILRGYSEPSTSPPLSAHSSYSHGLHDSTSEAYGDVYSPHDPFSERNRSDD